MTQSSTNPGIRTVYRNMCFQDSRCPLPFLLMICLNKYQDYCLNYLGLFGGSLFAITSYLLVICYIIYKDILFLMTKETSSKLGKQ